jgi:mannose-1-phosphate guanylyltransferase
MTHLPRKAFLLAAGNGTRLRPLTDSAPKCLLPIAGMPMLEIWLRRCEEFGIEEVLINLHSHSDQVRRFLLETSFRVQVQVSDEPVLLGSAGTINANRAWVENEESFWIFYADVLTSFDLRAMVNQHRALGADATIGTYRVPDPSRCGIVQTDPEGWVTEFIEKPAKPVGNLAFSGILLASEGFLSAVPPSAPSDIGFDVLPRVARLAAYKIEDYLIDIGTLENYRSAQVQWPGAARAREGVTV